MYLILTYIHFLSVNCFELTSMLTGKWLMTMFETGEVTNVSTEQKSEKYSYEFICEMNIEKYCKLLDIFFLKNVKDLKYVILQPDKVIFCLTIRLL